MDFGGWLGVARWEGKIRFLELMHCAWQASGQAAVDLELGLRLGVCLTHVVLFLLP